MDLRPEFSAVARDGEDEKDDTLEPFALPIPKQAKTSDGQFRVGPGAPEAFVEREYSVFPTVADIHSWVREKADFKKEVERQFEDYFSGQETIQSFISIPVARENSAAERPIAVLNVHSDRPGLLTDAAGIKIEYCAPLLDPFVYPLFLLLEAWSKAPDSPTSGHSPPQPQVTSD